MYLLPLTLPIMVVLSCCGLEGKSAMLHLFEGLVLGQITDRIEWEKDQHLQGFKPTPLSFKC